jgi:hypothetical protein
MAFNPYGGGYWERMADLALQGSQQQAEGIRQKWQNIGSIVPQTIGAVQDYAQQEQQMAYYKSNQRRVEMEMRRQEKAEDVARGVDLAISRGYNPETGSHDFKSSIGDVLNQSSDTFMGPSEYGRHTGAIVRELDEMQGAQRSRMKQDYVAEQQFKSNFIDQSSQLVRDFLKAHPQTDEPARQAQYGKDWEKFVQKSINPMLGSSDDPVKASVIAEMRPEIPRFGGEFSAWNRDVVEGLLAAGETVNERISQEEHNIKMSNRASHYLRGHTGEAGILALQWTRDHASGLLQNIVTDQESLEKQLGLVKGEMSDQNQDIVMDALKHAGLTVYDDEFPDRVELFANKALPPEQVDMSGYSQLQLAIYAGSGLERHEQDIDSLADTQARQRLDRAYQLETGDLSATPYMDEKAKLFEVHNAVKGENKNTSAINETLDKLHESFGEIDEEENLARATINRFGQVGPRGNVPSATKRELLAINLLLQSRDGGVMTEKELFEAASTPEGRKRLMDIVGDAVADEKEQLAVYLGEQQDFAGEDIAKEKMASYLSNPLNLRAKGETGKDAFPFIPDDVTTTLRTADGEMDWEQFLARRPDLTTKWALDWYADLDPLVEDFEDPRVREVFEEVSDSPLTRERSDKTTYSVGGGDGWFTEADLDEMRDSFNKFVSEIKVINEENKKLRDGIFQDFSMDMKEASPADPLSQDRQWGRPYIRWNLDILEPLTERAWWDDGSFFRNYPVPGIVDE